MVTFGETFPAADPAWVDCFGTDGAVRAWRDLKAAGCRMISITRLRPDLDWAPTQVVCQWQGVEYLVRTPRELAQVLVRIAATRS